MVGGGESGGGGEEVGGGGEGEGSLGGGGGDDSGGSDGGSGGGGESGCGEESGDGESEEVLFGGDVLGSPSAAVVSGDEAIGVTSHKDFQHNMHRKLHTLSNQKKRGEK